MNLFGRAVRAGLVLNYRAVSDDEHEMWEKLAEVLAVVEDDDVGVIGVDDDALMRTPRSTVASGAFVISVTGSSSR
ncbi:hypothetical protein [Mycolicibacterium sp. NCC-Tsukiji]|uniref:hypothetical protein n=1 Tax=Mycolicibacterium sp. NCC-Tsukiji TaxID=2185272 RepID=UPI00107EFF9C|nr:hypothetical protein [Mycolicibacterium sp. NCC-Tsukiji]